jgi:hypothetical protein
MDKEMKIIGTCPLCEAHSLHIIGKNEYKTQQCISCGYVTSEKFKMNENMDKREHLEYIKLTEEMKEWSVISENNIWIPTVLTLPLGMLYPINVDNMVNHKTELKWAFAPMVDITEEEQKNYPDGKGGFFEKRIDTDNPKIYDVFVEGMHELNLKMKKEGKQKPGIKLPKLKKIK